MKLLISVPCYNEELLIEKTIKKLPRKIEGFEEVKILVIDDGSTDKTADILKTLDIDIYFRFEKNVGLAKVFEKSLSIAKKNDFDVMVNFDADNQYPEEKIVDLCRPILEQKTNYCIGSRNFNNAKDFSPIKIFLQKIGNKIFSYILFKNTKEIRDFTSGFRALHKSLYDKLEFYSTYSYTVESIVQLYYLNEKIFQIDINTNSVPRPSRLVNSNFDFIIKQTITLIKILVIHNPLQIFLKTSFLFLLISFLIFLRYFFFFFQGSGSDHIASLIAGSIIFTLSIFCLLIGLISDQIISLKKIIEKLKNRNE